MTDRHSPKSRRTTGAPARGGARAEKTLGSLLAGVTVKVKGGCALDPGFDDRLRELDSEITARVHDELLTPITRANFTTVLDRIRRAYKRAEFSEQLREAGRNLYLFVRSANLRGHASYYKACTLAYELHDNFYIDPSINEWAAKEGKRVYDRLREKLEVRRADLASSDRKLLREQILWCTGYGNELRRKGLADEALNVFRALYRFTQKVMTDATPCYATRGVIVYHLGSVYRMKEAHGRAEAMYTRAVDLYFRRSCTRPGELEEFIFSTRRVAMCIGFGIGWVNLTRGNLGRAENALTVARALMAHIQDPLVRHYIELLWGSIRRCRAGSDEAKLAPAVEVLTQAREFFQAQGHPLYEARACWELALAYNCLGEYGKSEDHLRVTEQHALRNDNDAWKSKVHLLRSRNLRSQDELEASLHEALEALTTAESSGIPVPQSDALIACGEARLRLAAMTRQAAATYADALEDFHAALDHLLPEGKSLAEVEHTRNDKVAAVCALRIAECHVKRKEWREATEYLERWQALSQRVEHEWVRELARKVAGELKKRKDFAVSAADVGTLKYKEATDELQEWLVTQALLKTNHNQERAAKLLGLKRPRIGQVLKRIEAKKKKAAEAEVKEVVKQPPPGARG